MQAGSKRIARDTGTAMAVLAMYLLLLLAPWHQAAALQHELADLGYVATATLDLCGGAATDQDGSAATFKCHMAGAGKFELSGVAPGAAALDLPRRAHDVAYAAAPMAVPHPVLAGAQQPRAPPATA